MDLESSNMENGDELGGSPQLSLQWHQHHNTLVSLLDALWERQELVDVTLAADGKYIRVHRIVLCACSNYFQDILTLKGNSDKQTIIFLKDVSYEDLKALVDYMYKGEVRINEDQLNSFLHTAKSLGVHGLMGNGKKAKLDNSTNKRKSPHSSFNNHSSVELSSDEQEDDDLHSQTEESTTPLRLRHNKTSLTRHSSIVEVKSEALAEQESRYESPTADGSQPNEMESLNHQSSISVHELDDDELDLFQQCSDAGAPDNNHQLLHAGTSRLSAEEVHPSGQELVDHLSWAALHNGTVIDSHHHHQHHHSHSQHHQHHLHHDPEPGPGRHSCPRCGRTYKWKQTLLRHVKYECGVEPQFICPVCRAPFHHRNVLQRHMNLHSRPK